MGHRVAALPQHAVELLVPGARLDNNLVSLAHKEVAVGMRIADQNRSGVVDEVVGVVEGRVAGAATSWSDLGTESTGLRLLMRLSGRGRRESACERERETKQNVTRFLRD